MEIVAMEMAIAAMGIVAAEMALAIAAPEMALAIVALEMEPVMAQ